MVLRGIFNIKTAQHIQVFSNRKMPSRMERCVVRFYRNFLKRRDHLQNLCDHGRNQTKIIRVFPFDTAKAEISFVFFSADLLPSCRDGPHCLH